MIYSNFEFFLLLFFTVLLYCLPIKSSFRFTILLASSLFFYAWSGLFDSLIFLFVVALSWLSALMAHRDQRRKALYLTLGVSVMVLHLFFWKYASWVSRNIQAVFPEFLGGVPLVLPLPVGISFFTLQGIAYLVDLGKGEAKFIPFREYLLFKSFFPQLVAGPIVRGRQLLPQLERLALPTSQDLTVGIGLFIMGFVKKMLLADRISPFVDAAFQDPAHFHRRALVLAVLGYTVQIWADFSGYTDMGRGAARMLGFRLPENFLSPYLSRSPSEFWRRWHITLSQWIRDYIYIPLGGSSGGRVRALLVVLVTMTISGLWHGAEWTFLIWGLYHGALLVGERLLSPFASAFRWCSGWLREVGLGVLMFSLTAFGWLIFRAQGLEQLWVFLKSVFRNVGEGPEPRYWVYVGVGLFLCFATQVAFYYDFALKRWTFLDLFKGGILTRLRLDFAVGGLLGGAAAAAILLLVFAREKAVSSAFIYFQF